MQKKQKQVLAIGAGVAALAAAAAGVYMLTGKNSKNRKKIGKWMQGMQNDIVKQLNKAQKVSQSGYNKIVDTVAKNYEGLRNVNTEEVALAAEQLKSHWNSILTEMNAASRTVRNVVPKAARSVAQAVKVNTGRSAQRTAKKFAKRKTRR
jgi:soluble cytochrome b562